MKEQKKCVPEIRFAGFTDDWEQRKLGELGSTYNGLSGKSKKDFGYGDAKYITYMNVYSNPLATLTELDNISIDERQNKVLSGDVLFTTSSETPEEVGMSSVWRFNESNIYLNSFCFGYRPIETFDPNFLAYMLRSNSVRNRIILLAQGISRYNISKKAMMEIEILFPSIKEQTAIGNFFKQLDDTIALHRRNCIKFQNLKAAYLENIFSAKYIQNKDKNKNAWEQRKLGEVLKIKSGMSQKNIEDPTGVYPILATGGEIGRTNTFIYNRESVLIGRKGTINRPYYMNTPFWTVDTLFYSELSENISGLFIYNLFQTIDWMSYDTSTGVPSLTSSAIHNINVYLPKSKEEQTAIGNFFKQLDDTIALHQKELAKYQQIKAACLEKMFVK